MADMGIKFVGSGGFSPPRQDEKEITGFTSKPPLFPPGTPKSPYVKDRAGMIWFYEPWMDDMGNELQPCWEAPPRPEVRVAVSPMDISAYAQQPPQASAQQPVVPPTVAHAQRASVPSFAAASESQNL